MMRVVALVAVLAGVSLLVLGSVTFVPPPIVQAAEEKAEEQREPADNSYCYACHVNYQDEKLTAVHEPVGVGCETCHGPSIEHSGDEDNITPPDRMFPKPEINAYCVTCHEKGKLLKDEIHEEFFTEGDASETCNDCHAEKHRLKVRTRIWDKKTGKLIQDDGVRMMEEKKE
jgi:hypothetical protein